MGRKAFCPLPGLIAAILRFVCSAEYLYGPHLGCGAGGGWGRRSWSQANTFAASSGSDSRAEQSPGARVIDTRFPQEGYLLVDTDEGVVPPVPETTQGNYDGGRRLGSLNDPSCPWIPRILRTERPICGGGCVRVLFSESPPLMRKNSGQSP